MFSHNKRLIIFISALLFLSQPFLAQAYIGVAPANPDPKVKFSDSWFVYTLKQRQAKEDAIIINNHSENIVTVRIFPVEAALNSQGTFYTDAEKQVDQGVSQWVAISKSEIKLGPGESQKVEFVVKLPRKIEPKQYLGAVMAEEIKTEKPGEAVNEENQVGQSFNMRSMVGVRMYLTVVKSKSKFTLWLVLLPIIIIVLSLIYYFYLKPKQKKSWWHWRERRKRWWQKIFKR